jgi:hypothetical protein
VHVRGRNNTRGEASLSAKLALRNGLARPSAIISSRERRARARGRAQDNARLTICEPAAEKIIAYKKNSCIVCLTRLCAARPISHVPVAACRLVGIRTRGRTAARSKRREKFSAA